VDSAAIPLVDDGREHTVTIVLGVPVTTAVAPSAIPVTTSRTT
jgi:hypothetical protein